MLPIGGVEVEGAYAVFIALLDDRGRRRPSEQGGGHNVAV